MRVLLVNPNRIRPPVAPLGLDYLADALAARGAEVRVLDLCLEPEVPAAVADAFGPDVVGVTLRNTDDCYFGGQDFFLPQMAEVVAELRAATSAPVILGGVGFSVMPEAVLELCGADLGLRGEGEFGFPALAARLAQRRPVDDLPGLVRRTGSGFRANPCTFGDLAELPFPSRRWMDNGRYFREGGQLGFETKRGCAGRCTYCADPLAKGNRVRLHAPERVVAELRTLLAQGADHLHTCDSEFNLPPDHALAVCEAISAAGMGSRLRWYAYCAPRPFSRELALAMARAGCAGIDFGADHADPGQLSRLGRDHGPEDLLGAAEACRAAGLPFLFDLLLGGPGETRQTLEEAISFMRRVDAPRVGLSVGVRVYPGTALAQTALAHPEGLRPLPGPGGPDLARPAFYLSPALGDELPAIVAEHAGNDPRFLFADPTKKEQNYNYNANRVLEEAIAAGARGAYWDILRRLAQGPPSPV
ncbi:MAG: radical SAM protein [Thermodesulfobacteriota bacterium]